MIVSWSDDDEADGDTESDTAKRVTSMTGRVESESGDDDPHYETVTVPYNYQDINDVDTSKLLIEQEEIINHLQEERIGHLARITELNKDVMLLNSKLVNVLKQVRMTTTGTDVLDRMLEGQVSRKPNGIGFTHEHLKHEHQNSSYVQALEHYHKAKKGKPVKKIKFVASIRTDSTTVKEPRLEHPIELPKPGLVKEHPSWKCHFCNRQGHKKPFCYKLYGAPRVYQPRPAVKMVKKKWRPKCVGLIAHTSLRASSSEDWYFYSGCSRHMTGVDKFLEKVRPYAKSYVTFGDGAKGKIVGIGNLVNEGSPRLDNVLLVKGLAANFISISQLCDQGMSVNFSKTECQIIDGEGKVSMKGTRSKDNCYLLVSQEQALIASCMLSKDEEVRL